MAEEKAEKAEKPKKTNKKTEVVSDRTKAENIEQEIVELAKKGNHPAKIGLILKEKYGIDKFRALGKRITKILKENSIKFENDLDFVNKKIKHIESHYQKNKQDKKSEREIIRYIGLRKKLEKYYAKKKA